MMTKDIMKDTTFMNLVDKIAAEYQQKQEKLVEEPLLSGGVLKSDAQSLQVRNRLN